MHLVTYPGAERLHPTCLIQTGAAGLVPLRQVQLALRCGTPAGVVVSDWQQCHCCWWRCFTVCRLLCSAAPDLLNPVPCSARSPSRSTRVGGIFTTICLRLLSLKGYKLVVTTPVSRATGMVGWLGGWMDGWMHGWMDGWMDGWMANHPPTPKTRPTKPKGQSLDGADSHHRVTGAFM